MSKTKPYYTSIHARVFKPAFYNLIILFQVLFKVGVNKEGEIQYLKNTFYQDGGCSYNEINTEITVHHFYNCYDSKRWYIQANSVITDTASNTWCRSPSKSSK